MIQHKKHIQVRNLNLLSACDNITKMTSFSEHMAVTSSTQNQWFAKNLGEHNPHAKFDVSMTFGLGQHFST